MLQEEAVRSSDMNNWLAYHFPHEETYLCSTIKWQVYQHASLSSLRNQTAIHHNILLQELRSIINEKGNNIISTWHCNKTKNNTAVSHQSILGNSPPEETNVFPCFRGGAILQYRTHMPNKRIFHKFLPAHPKIDKNSCN